MLYGHDEDRVRREQLQEVYLLLADVKKLIQCEIIVTSKLISKEKSIRKKVSMARHEDQFNAAMHTLEEVEKLIANIGKA